MVRVVQRDMGIRLAFCIRDGVNRIRASLSAVIALAVHILGDRQIGHLAEDVLDGVALSVFVQIIVYNRHVLRILRILDSLHMQGIPLLHINHVNRVILLAEDKIGLVEGVSVFILALLHRVIIRIVRAAVFLIERLQRNGDAHAVARARVVLVLAACDKFCAERAGARDGLQQAVRVFARKQEFKGHARQRLKLADLFVVLRFGGRPVFLIQLHLEQTLELGLPAAHHIGLVVCVHFRHGIDRSRRSRPHAAVDLLIAACVVDLHLPEQEGIFADVVAQLKSVRHERARAHAARAGFIGDSVSNQFALLRFGGENSFQLRFRASICSFFHRLSHLRRFKLAVAGQQFALFFRQVSRADGVNLKLAVIQRLRLADDNAFRRRVVCKLNRVADLVQLQLHIVLVIGDAALTVVLIIGLFARQFNIVEVIQHILIIARLSVVVRRIVAVRMNRIFGIGAVSVRNFRFHEHIVLEAVQIGDRRSRVRHVDRLNPFKRAVVLHFVERHRRARQRILRRVAALQLIFLLVIQADVESGLRLIFKRQRLAGIFVQLELLLVFRLEISLRRLLLLHRVRQRRGFVVRIAVNRQAGQLKRPACALFARVNQRVRRFVEHKVGFQQRLIGIAVLREVRRVHRDRELRQIRRVHIIDVCGLRVQLFLLLVAQLNRQAADVRLVGNSQILRPIRLAIRQRPKFFVVEHHVAGNRRFPDIVRAVSRDGEHADRLRLAHHDRLTDRLPVLVVQGKRRKAAVRHLGREIFGHLKLILPPVNLFGLPAVVARLNRQLNEFRIQIVVLRCGQLLQIIGSSFLHREHQFDSAVRVRRETIRVRHIFGLGQAPRFIHNGRRLFRQHAVRQRPPDQIGRAIRFPGQHGINRAGQYRVVAACFGEGRLADLTRVGDGDRLVRIVVQRHALLAVRHRIAFCLLFDDGISHHMAVFVPAAQRKGLACLVLFAVGRQFNRLARQLVALFAGSPNRDRPRLFFVQAAHIDKPLRDG